MFPAPETDPLKVIVEVPPVALNPMVLSAATSIRFAIDYATVEPVLP